MIDINIVKIVGMLIPIVGIIGLFTMIIFLRKYENDEKMAMIDKGINPIPTPVQSTPEQSTQGNKTFLFLGFVIVGFGIGLLMGSLLESLTNIDGDVAHFSMIFIFGGLGLLSSYFYQMNVDKKNRINKDV